MLSAPRAPKALAEPPVALYQMKMPRTSFQKPQQFICYAVTVLPRLGGSHAPLGLVQEKCKCISPPNQEQNVNKNVIKFILHLYIYLLIHIPTHLFGPFTYPWFFTFEREV